MEPGLATRRRIRGAALALGLLLLTAGSAAKAGFCAGDRERVVKIAERLRFDLGQELGWLQVRLVQPAVLRSRIVTARLALWKLYVQSRQEVLEGLLAGELGGERLARIRSLWQQAEQVRGYMASQPSGERPGEALPGLRGLVEHVLASWAACRAIRDEHGQACRLLEPLNPGLAETCRGPSVDVRSFARWCRSFGFKAMSNLADALRERCRKGGNDAGELCAELTNGVDEEALICLAVRAGDPAACVRREFSAAARLECESTVIADRYLNGGVDERAFRKAYRVPSFADAIAAVGPSGRDCLVVALDEYDRFASVFFQVAPSPLGGLPDL